MDDTIETTRLHVYLARCGVGSRRACERLISAGDVKVNGTTVTEQGVKVSDGDVVTYQGKRVTLEDTHVYFALNKPVRYLCSMSDQRGRACAIELLKDATDSRIYNVGRLDYLSSGLIFFTNDGDFAQAVMHPSREIEKEYIVDTKDPIPREELMKFRRGVVVDGEKYTIKWFKYRERTSVKLVLTEGKNREIRALFASRNITIRKLHRVRIGPVTIKGIPSGCWRPLSKKEISFFNPDMDSDQRRYQHGHRD